MLQSALDYISPPLNWRLCKIRPESKAPVLNEWNSPLLSIGDSETAISNWGNGKYGIGLVHESSKTGAFDIDDLDWATFAFNEFGIDINSLIEGYPRIKGKDGRAKIIFNMPESLSTIKLVWPPKNKNDKPITVFELRGKGGQDVLPPSIHPDTKSPYEWLVTPLGFQDGIPECPSQLLVIWSKWSESFKSQFESACPWIDQSIIKNPKNSVRQVSNKKHNNVIGQFNDAHDIVTMLES